MTAREKTKGSGGRDGGREERPQRRACLQSSWETHCVQHTALSSRGFLTVATALQGGWFYLHFQYSLARHERKVCHHIASEWLSLQDHLSLCHSRLSSSGPHWPASLQTSSHMNNRSILMLTVWQAQDLFYSILKWRYCRSTSSYLCFQNPESGFENQSFAFVNHLPAKCAYCDWLWHEINFQSFLFHLVQNA